MSNSPTYMAILRPCEAEINVTDEPTAPSPLVLDLANPDPELCRQIGITPELLKGAVLRLDPDVFAAQREEALRRAVERLVAEIPQPPPSAPARRLRLTRDPATVPEVIGPSHRRLMREKTAKTYASTREAGRREVGREGLRAWQREHKENR